MDVPDPTPAAGALLVRTLAIGICGTDREILEGKYGTGPEGADYLILGHESLGKVVAAERESGFAPGDHVVGIVRRPDPVPCHSCAAGEWDMCKNGRYTERGIKGRHGFASERFVIRPEYAVKVDPSLGLTGVLLEPASVVAKAWEHIERIGRRSATWAPSVALILGAGPVGLLAALLGAQRGLRIHVFDRLEQGLKPELVRALGATYHAGSLQSLDVCPDVVLECTGATELIFEAMSRTAAAGIVCLTGVSSGGRRLDIDLGLLNRSMVLENDAVFGSVNANRRHFEQAARALVKADRDWLARLISRRVPLERWSEAIHPHPDDIKTVLTF